MARSYRLSASTGIAQGDRDYQQDQIALLKHPHVHGCLLAVVADGMGGKSGGRKAADQVLLTATQLFERFRPGVDHAVTLLKQIVQEAHLVIKLIAIASEQEPHSTLAAFLIQANGECHWVHSGDSRIYHYHEKNLVKRTLDHSYVQALVSSGQITQAQAQNHPKSNFLIGCLGTNDDPPMDFHSITQLQPHDVLMCCSDGLWQYFTSAELGLILSSLSPRESTEFLIQKARTRACGKGDNLSLAVVKLESL
jgi:PPM family protein phosphatase